MIADVCVIAVVAAFAAIGMKAGLMRSIIKLLAYVISIVASFALYPILSELLMKTKLFEALADAVNENYISKGIEGSGLPEFVTRYFGTGINAAADTASHSIAALLINIIAFVVILIVSRIILKLAEKLLSAVTHLPLIRHFNRLGGTVLGGIVGIIVLYAAFAVTVLFVPLDESGYVASEIESSHFASEMYDNNALLKMIEKRGANAENGKV